MAPAKDENAFQSEQLPEYLPVYYKRLFPFELYYRWMSYGNLKKNYFLNREFSFTLKDDIYIRYQSFADRTEFENEVMKACPYKIDIGAVYNYKPSDRRAISSLKAMEKELVFDIDMTDYDEVRTCCEGTSVCPKCWPFMTVAIKILHRALTEDFGFQHLLWVFSGRRGVHCWVCDESARQLSPSARTAIVQYLSLVQGGEFKSKKVNLRNHLHPSVRESVKVVKEYFPSLILNNQELLESKEQYEKVIGLCTDSKLKETLTSKLSKSLSSEERWDVITSIHDALTKKGTLKKDHLLLEEIMLQMCYPRLDVNVSKGLNHLLKAPFCVHPKTGQVCIPIDPNRADEFDPTAVPNVSQLIEEIDSFSARTGKDASELNTIDKMNREPDYKKTSLNGSYKLFQDFVKRMESSWNKQKLAENDAKMEF